MHNPNRLSPTMQTQQPSTQPRRPLAPEPVLLRSASNPLGFQAALIDDDGDGGITIMVNLALPLRSVYNIDRPGVGGHHEGVLFVVEQSRTGGRSGEIRLGHFLTVLRQLRPDA